MQKKERLEKDKVERARKGEIALSVLRGIGIAGLLVIAVAAPNAMQIVPLFQEKKRRYTKTALYYSLRNLQRRGLVRLVRGRNGWRVELTEKGRREFLLYEVQEKLLVRPKRWDGIWHLLIFDIAEERRGIRDALRRTLTTFGFYRLQDSVWVFPYPCEEVLELLRTKYRIRHDALYVSANRIANDRALREHFGLQK